MQQLINMDVGVLLPEEEVEKLNRDGEKILRSKMIYKRKYAISPMTGKEGFLKWKGRLAVNGAGQTEGVDTVWNTFSPTIGFTAIRTMISVLCNPKYLMRSYDLSGAFLGTKLENQAVYVRLPPDAGEYANKVIRLTKSVYGIKNSGSSFMKQLSDRILSFTERVETDVLSDAGEANAGKAKARKRVEVAGFEKTLTDQCMYVYRDSIGREMIFLSYVDDIVCATTDKDLRDRFFAHLKKSWDITCEGTLDRFLAVHFTRSQDGWSWKADMRAYIEKIANRFGLTETKQYRTPMDPGFVLAKSDFTEEPTEEMKTEVRSMVGSIGYGTLALRYDTAYALSVLSRHLVRPCKKVLDAARHVIIYLYCTRDFFIEWSS